MNLLHYSTIVPSTISYQKHVMGQNGTFILNMCSLFLPHWLPFQNKDRIFRMKETFYSINTMILGEKHYAVSVSLLQRKNTNYKSDLQFTNSPSSVWHSTSSRNGTPCSTSKGLVALMTSLVAMAAGWPLTHSPSYVTPEQWLIVPSPLKWSLTHWPWKHGEKMLSLFEAFFESLKLK